MAYEYQNMSHCLANLQRLFCTFQVWSLPETWAAMYCSSIGPGQNKESVHTSVFLILRKKIRLKNHVTWQVREMRLPLKMDYAPGLPSAWFTVREQGPWLRQNWAVGGCSLGQLSAALSGQRSTLAGERRACTELWHRWPWPQHQPYPFSAGNHTG